jgi:hypothetical protein
MKTKVLLFTGIIILSLLSCKKDSQGPSTTSSKFTYNGKEYALGKGYIHHDLDKRFDVSFFSSGVSVITENSALFVDGPGSWISPGFRFGYSIRPVFRNI